MTKKLQPSPNPDRPANMSTSTLASGVSVVREARLILDALQDDHCELIRWFDASAEVPVDQSIKLVRIEKPARVITRFGYYVPSLSKWRDSDGFDCDVRYWADAPEGPQ